MAHVGKENRGVQQLCANSHELPCMLFEFGFVPASLTLARSNGRAGMRAALACGALLHFGGAAATFLPAGECFGTFEGSWRYWCPAGVMGLLPFSIGWEGDVDGALSARRPKRSSAGLVSVLRDHFEF